MTEHANPGWVHRAACRSEDYDPEMWFPVGTSPKSPDAQRAQDAIKVCESCPVRLACAQQALQAGSRLYGIWAGFRIDPERVTDPKKPLRDYVKREGARVEEPSPVVCTQCGDTYVPHSKRTLRVCRFCIDDLVDARPARAHIIALSRHLPFTVISELIDAEKSTVSEIARGKRPRIKTALSARILALQAGVVVRA